MYKRLLQDTLRAKPHLAAALHQHYLEDSQRAQPQDEQQPKTDRSFYPLPTTFEQWKSMFDAGPSAPSTPREMLAW
jgi:hypothetical protein